MKLKLAVVMRKEFIDNPWISYRWALDEVIFDIGQFAHKQPDFEVANKPAVCMRKDEEAERWQSHDSSCFLSDEINRHYFTDNFFRWGRSQN
jgi:hypothetical protein